MTGSGEFGLGSSVTSRSGMVWMFVPAVAVKVRCGLVRLVWVWSCKAAKVRSGGIWLGRVRQPWYGAVRHGLVGRGMADKVRYGGVVCGRMWYRKAVLIRLGVVSSGPVGCGRSAYKR